MGDSPSRPYQRLEQRIGHEFVDSVLCEAALTHKSWLNEAPQSGRTDNERLEFLGDAVLNLAISDRLMRRFQDRSEGELSKTRAVIVSESGLARAADAISLGDWVFLGRGEEQAGGRRKASILANAMEAVVGAVFLDGGFDAACRVADKLFGESIAVSDQKIGQDYKSRLQERSQALLRQTPQYSVVGHEGPDHDKTFWVAIRLDGRELGRAAGKSKKEAEQNSAALALAQLESGDLGSG